MVARLRAAGAIFIGKTNVPEFGFGSHSYNTVFGTTLNAYDQSRTAGGSSGGAASGAGGAHGTARRWHGPCRQLAQSGRLQQRLRLPPELRARPRPRRQMSSPRRSRSQARWRGASRTWRCCCRCRRVATPRVPLSIHARCKSGVTAPLDVPVAGRRIGWLGDLERLSGSRAWHPAAVRKRPRCVRDVGRRRSSPSPSASRWPSCGRLGRRSAAGAWRRISARSMRTRRGAPLAEGRGAVGDRARAWRYPAPRSAGRWRCGRGGICTCSGSSSDSIISCCRRRRCFHSRPACIGRR